MEFITKAYLCSAIFCAASTTAVFAQQTKGIITGSVSELVGKSAEPLMGVNVNIVNSQNRSLAGTITNLNGQFNIKVPEGEKNLTVVFSFIGMKTQKIRYNGQATMNIRMESDARKVDEVVITAARRDRNDMGIGNQEMISATQKVDMEKLVATSPVTSVEEALQGQLGGVDITLGGDPGTKSSIRIRGVSTLNGSSDPLIVIDGVPYPANTDDFDFSNANEEDLGALLNISPNDIATIEVLKDASATAIWGTQGANGVLVITTKKGTAGKTRFSFSSKWTTNIEPESIPMLNGSEYVALMNDAIWNTANYVGVSNAGTYLEKLFNTPEIGHDVNWTYFDEYNQNTDWLKLVRRNSLTSDNSFSMTGGGEKANYRLSLGYLDENGTTIGTALKRFNSSLNISYQFSNKLRFGANFTYTESNRDANWTSTVRSEAFSKMPNKSPYIIDDLTGLPKSEYFTRQTSDWEGVFSSNDTGSSARNYNPVAMVHEASNETNQREGKITIDAQYNILPGFTYRGYASINIRTIKTNRFLPQSVTGVTWSSKFANQAYDTNSENLSIQTENKFNYIKNWNDRHNLIANAVFRTNQYTNSSYGSMTSGMASSDMSDSSTSTNVQQLASGKSETRSVAGIVLLNYTLLNRYVFQGSIDVEGNSAMGEDQRVGYFPGAGVNWNIQNEPFAATAKDKWLDEAKIRFSVGQSGRAPSGSSIYLGSFVGGQQYNSMSAIIPSRMQLNDLKWETKTEYNAGFDLTLWKGRLKVTVDYYQQYTSDMLQRNFSIPSTTGYSNISYYNSGKSTNRGWEFRTDGILFRNNDWIVTGYMNLARNRNEITELPKNMVQENYTLANGAYAFRIEQGRPIGSFFGYRYLGVYQNKDATYARDVDGNIMNDLKGNPIIMKNGTYVVYPGDAKYEDINHDGVINEYDIVYLGNSQPMVTGGAGLSIKYKQVTLSASLHGRFGQSIVNSARMNNEAMYNGSNQSKAVLHRWRNEGDDTDIPRALYNYGLNYLGSDRFVEDASFLRLKTVTVTYDFPKSITDRLGVNKLGLFATAYNLFTWTNYTGQDPEVNIPGNATSLAQDSATTPVSKRFAVGLNLNF